MNNTDAHTTVRWQDSGDGWAIGHGGQRFWGIEGAAGLLLRAPAPDGTPMVLLQLRSEWTSMPLTVGVPGGARDLCETPTQAALREAAEETGIDLSQVHVVQADVTARIPCAYGLRRIPAHLMPGLPYFLGIGRRPYVGVVDPSLTEWTYTTVAAFADHPLEVTMNNESIKLWWCPETEVEEHNLMAPFREAWPRTRCLVEYGDVDAPTMLPATGDAPNPRWVMPRP